LFLWNNWTSVHHSRIIRFAFDFTPLSILQYEPIDKIPILILITWMSIQHTQAQKYSVQMESDRASFFIGRVDIFRIYIQDSTGHAGDYKFHVQAQGAEIGYEQEICNPCESVKLDMKILPNQKEGTINIVAEKKGKFHKVMGTLYFEGRTLPTLGIDPLVPSQTKLSKAIIFHVPKNQKIENSSLEIGSTNFSSNLYRDRSNRLKVQVMLSKDSMYVPQRGDIGMVSTDAKIKKLNKNIFEVSPLPEKGRCQVSVFFNGKKISHETLTILPIR
jgi:hypothetical protein